MHNTFWYRRSYAAGPQKAIKDPIASGKKSDVYKGRQKGHEVLASKKRRQKGHEALATLLPSFFVLQ